MSLHFYNLKRCRLKMIVLAWTLSFSSLLVRTSEAVANQSCLEKLNPSGQTTDGKNVISDLARLRIAIEDAKAARLTALASTLSGSYQLKLNAAEKMNVPLHTLASEIAKLRRASEEQGRQERANRARLAEQEFDELEWTSVRKLILPDSVEKMIIDTNDAHLIAGARNGSVMVWGLKPGSINFRLDGHKHGIVNLKLVANEKILMSASLDSVILWDVDSAKQIRSFDPKGSSIQNVEINSDGTRLAIYRSSDTIEVWDTNKKLPEFTIDVATSDMTKAAYFKVYLNKDASQILAINNTSASVYKTSDGTKLYTLKGQLGQINDGSFSPSGREIMTVADDGSAIEWDAQTGLFKSMIFNAKEPLFSGRYNAGGSQIIITAKTGQAWVWNKLELNSIKPLSGHDDLIFDTFFSPTRNQVITGGLDGMARVWNLTNNSVQVLDGKMLWIKSVLFTHDGNTIVTGSSDANIKVWKKPMIKDETQ